MQSSSRRPLVVALALLCCLSLLTPVVATPDGPDRPCTGTVTEEADGMTVISVQGMRWSGNDSESGWKPAKLVGVGPGGEIKWVHHSTKKYDVVWGYDVDPLPNGNVFVTATVRGHETLVYELNPRTQETVWSKTFDLADTHDADLINDGTAIVVANMRNYDEEAGRNDDRIFVYNRTTDEITWEWYFDDHYDRQDLAENYTDDWTHLNDVDKIGEDRFLASPRNFDQVIVVNRTTNEIEMVLGEDENFDILAEQHNPDYLESEDGTPTIIVGDSRNDRIVEYDNPDGDLTDGDGWERTWTLKGDLDWPRDADRLPDGNTLVTDSANHRVVEVTPTGEVVWEFYAPWLVYDAARVSVPGEHGGPTIRDLNATGTYEIHGGAGYFQNDTRLEACNAALGNVSGWAEGETPPTSESSGDGGTEGAMDDGTSGSDANDGSDSNGNGDGEASGNDAGTGGNDDGTSTDGTGVPGFGPLVAVVGVVVALAVTSRR